MGRKGNGFKDKRELFEGTIKYIRLRCSDDPTIREAFLYWRGGCYWSQIKELESEYLEDVYLLNKPLEPLDDGDDEIIRELYPMLDLYADASMNLEESLGNHFAVKILNDEVIKTEPGERDYIEESIDDIKRVIFDIEDVVICEV